MSSARFPIWAIVLCVVAGSLASGCSSPGQEPIASSPSGTVASSGQQQADSGSARPASRSYMANGAAFQHRPIQELEEPPWARPAKTNDDAPAGRPEDSVASVSKQAAKPRVRANHRPTRHSSPVIRLDGRDLTTQPAASPIQQTGGAVPFEVAVEVPESPVSPENVAPHAPRGFPVPLRGTSPEPEMQLDVDGQLISLSVREAPLNAVLSLIAEQQGLNIVTGSHMTLPVTVTLHDVTVDQALTSILKIAGCAWYRESDIIYVSNLASEEHVAPTVQGREVRVFQLDYVSATDVEKVVTGLLSPVGTIFSSESDPKNNRRTGEVVVVEDLPEYVRRVEQYIVQVDQPPRQVLIEAHILEVELTDNMTHGVNFDYLAEIANTNLRLETTGFANPMASTGMLFSVEGSDLSSLVEALQTTNDAKTLASPKVLVLNGQEARIQIGERLGYFVTTTTQTSTLQQVQFLDVGIVLRVTPQITADGRVIMTVQPEISTGEINDVTGLPDKNTTEVETSVVLNDGRGIIIGGLIQEADTDRQSKVPFIGDLWAVGRAFQRRVGVRDRSEIIVALVPRVVPYGSDATPQSDSELYRATTPLLDPNLKRYPRPGEGALPDAMRDPRRIEVNRLPDAIRNLNDDYPLPPEYYLPANSEQGEYCPDARYDVQQVPVYAPQTVHTSPVVIPYEDLPDAE